jgi:hypothetical protein
MLRELLASRAPAVGFLVLSALLAGVVPGCATPIDDLPQASTEQAAAPAAKAEDIERLVAEDTEPGTPSPAVVLPDPFNAAAPAAVETRAMGESW